MKKMFLSLALIASLALVISCATTDPVTQMTNAGREFEEQGNYSEAIISYGAAAKQGGIRSSNIIYEELDRMKMELDDDLFYAALKESYQNLKKLKNEAKAEGDEASEKLYIGIQGDLLTWEHSNGSSIGMDLLAG